MRLSLSEVIERTGCEVFPEGHAELSFEGVAPLDMAQSVHVSFLANEKYVDAALKSKAGALFCSPKHRELLSQQHSQSVLLVCQDPYAAFAKVAQVFFKPVHPFSGVSAQAVVDQSAQIHETATVFPFAFIGPGAVVKENSVIYSGCFVGAASTVGKDCILYPNVVVREGCHIGDRCVLNPGVVVGGDGFGFAPTEHENVKIPQIGGVQIAEDVELGANTTVDRGALGDTRIGRQTKIDNLVMIAHNVQIGEFCFLAGQVGVAGSTSIGNRVFMGGQVGVVGHIHVGDNSQVMAQAGISKNLPAGQTWGGSPAKPFKEYAAGLIALNKMARERQKKS